MPPKPMLQFIFSFLFLSLWGSTIAQGSVPSLFGQGTQLCSYQFAIPRAGDCGSYVPAMEDRFKSTRQELERIKQQFVNQNMALMEQIRQLRQQTSTADAEVADVTKDFKTLQAMVDTLRAKINTANFGHPASGSSSGSSSSSPVVSDVMVRQLLNATRHQMTQDMDQLHHDLNSALIAINRDRQSNAVQQSTVDSAFQDELRQQQQDLSVLLQRLQQLQLRVTALHSLGSNPNPPPPPAASAMGVPSAGGPAVDENGLEEQLQAEVKKLEGRVTDLENLLQKDVPDLKDTLGELHTLADNHSLTLEALRSDLDLLETSGVPSLRQKQQLNYGALQAVSTSMHRGLDPLIPRVQGVAQQVSSLVSQISRVGKDTLNMRVQLGKDETAIGDLDLQIKMLASRLSSLIRDQHLTTPRPPSTPPPSTTTFAIPTPKPHH